MSVSAHPLVFLGGHRKSGTTLFLTLFDGHPELSVYPSDVGLLYAYFPRFISAEYDDEARRDRLFKVAGEGFEEMCAAAGLDGGRFHTAFRSAVAGKQLNDMGGVLDAFVDGVHAVIPQQRWTVLKETSIEIYARELLDWFPNSRFIHLIRDPRDNYASLKSGVASYYSQMGENEKATLSSLLKRALLGMRLARLNARRFGPERYHVLRFEDLVAAPEQELRKICAFLDIAYDPCLTVPTQLGRSTHGNSYEGLDFSSISARNVGRWPKRISPEEARIIEFHFADLMAEFDYPVTSGIEEQMDAMSEFYKWENYKYHFSDRFAVTKPA